MMSRWLGYSPRVSEARGGAKRRGASVVVFVVILTLLVLGTVSCAKKTPADRPVGEPRADRMADPMDRRIAHAAVALRFDPNNSGDAGSVFKALDQGDETNSWGEQLLGGEELAELFEEPGQFEALDTEHPVYLAVTPKGNPRFTNALELSAILPVEEDPDWLHSRVLVGAGPGEAAELKEELKPLFDDGSKRDSTWKLRIDGDQVIADRLTALSPGTEPDANAGFDVLAKRARLGRRRASAARAQFAWSEAPMAIYVDYRRIGTVLAQLEAGLRRQKLADELDSDAATGPVGLWARWVADNNAAFEPFRLLNRRVGDYADVTVQPRFDGGEMEAQVVTSRTELGARSHELSQKQTFSIPEHPEGATVLRLEATSPTAGARPRQRVNRWLHGGEQAPGFDGLLERYTGVEPWLMSRRPGAVLSSLVDARDAQLVPRAVRVSVYPPDKLQDDSADEQSVRYPVVISAGFDPAVDNERLRRRVQQQFGDDFDWYIDSDDDELTLRLVRHGSVEEWLPDDAARSAPSDLSLRVDSSKVVDWRADDGLEGLRLIPPELFALAQGEIQLHAEHHPAHAKVSLTSDDRRSNMTVDRQLPDVPVVGHDVPPSCALDVQSMIARLVSEYHATPRADTDRMQTLSRRGVLIADRARVCEADYPTLPQLSRLLGRNLWQLGIRDERAGRLQEAAEQYRQGCQFGETLACRYGLRVRRAAQVDTPASFTQVRAGRSTAPLGGFVAGYVTVDELERVSVGDRTLGSLQELSDEKLQQRLVEEISERPLITPLRLLDAHPQWHTRAKNTTGLVADPGVETRRLLSSLTGADRDNSMEMQAYLEVSDEGASQRQIRTVLLEVGTGSVGSVLRRRDRRPVVHLKPEGIDVYDGGRRVQPIIGCPRGGPTICMAVKEGNDGKFPVNQLLEMMPDIPGWRTGGQRPVVVVDAPVEWGEFSELAVLLQDPNHPAWAAPAPLRPGWIMPRFGVPHPGVEVVVPVRD